VRRAEEGIASGAANAMRELGGVFGVAVLASVFSAHGSYAAPHAFQLGLRPAVLVGAVLVGIAALVLLAVPRGLRAVADETATPLVRDDYPATVESGSPDREPVAIGA
jgi:hypothetical protein